MEKDFEVQLSADFLARIDNDVKSNIKSLDCSGAFEAYNRGGGPAGSYDRHYDKSTGSIEQKTDALVA